ncbi:hypothetical protein [Streptomyces sp. NPDC048650]
MPPYPIHPALPPPWAAGRGGRREVNAVSELFLASDPARAGHPW